MNAKRQCVEMVYISERLASYSHQCLRTKTEIEGDKYYCFQHLPSRVKAADEARHKAWEAKWDEERRLREEAKRKGINQGLQKGKP